MAEMVEPKGSRLRGVRPLPLRSNCRPPRLGLHRRDGAARSGRRLPCSRRHSGADRARAFAGGRWRWERGEGGAHKSRKSRRRAQGHGGEDLIRSSTCMSNERDPSDWIRSQAGAAQRQYRSCATRTTHGMPNPRRSLSKRGCWPFLSAGTVCFRWAQLIYGMGNYPWGLGFRTAGRQLHREMGSAGFWRAIE